MKNILLITLTTICLNSYSQYTICPSVNKNDINNYREPISLGLKKQIPSLSTALVAGILDGTFKTLKYHYNDGFKRTFPNARDTYWDVNVSWKNKYKNLDPNQGPKFIGSDNIFSFAMEGYNLTRTSRNAMIFTTLIVYMDKSENKKWYNYVIDLAAHTLAYQIGFYTSYKGVFKN